VFHGSHQHPFLKKCTILHCILNLSSPFSLRYFLKLPTYPGKRLELSTLKLW